MDLFEESLQENIDFEGFIFGDEDSNTFEEFLDPEEYIDLGHLFTTERIFSSKDELFHRPIYNVITKIKRDRMQGRNTVEEVLRLSTERGYTVFYRNGEDSNVLSDIVVAHPTSIAMIRTWPYVLIMDTTYKTNKYNMPLLECVGMTPTGKNFTVATAFMFNEQATTYRWVLQQIKHL
ncbi:hypothetical protein M9H77_32167 [Catharanthus roseus]|uniref:Uncharacterized protein n=1 Tax=Catharanthus roseus TaxID=4058 RepID=A0ACC0A3Z9_CATRO|nr:hypothetical protein M9H77_32167 [Catharanthus roseus]